ncbi:winged helix-turn-helix domain-containing protein [Fodinicola feengrottensis]|uniref:winged helix-turn-helix domain-containing protein n=1 Tax=Fodinicola feengrottensis TaxID=435914 RepID=UPI0028BF0740|nr:crosslink repair DNA glycosylase YcaQ family protein [Fodinicola feengrottensis]
MNVLVRSHYLPLFSRLGVYKPELLERAAYGRQRELFEYWGHVASLLPVTTQPLLRWRMERAAVDSWGMIRRLQEERPGFIEEVRKMVAELGPVSAGDIAEPRQQKAGPWWDWDDTKSAMEWLFYTGEITCSTRRGFERVYDLTERALPPEVVATPTPEPAQAHRGLIKIAAHALGVATEPELRDYFRQSPADSKRAVAELVEAGELTEVSVQGWSAPAYLDPAAKIPRKVDATALLSPFDSLVFERKRTERIFGFRYRLEIYVPAPKRVYGYYVLPFLRGESLVARVDLKADRQGSLLRVPAVHSEIGHDLGGICEDLAGELLRLADWLGLSGVAPPVAGDLAKPLKAALNKQK